MPFNIPTALILSALGTAKLHLDSELRQQGRQWQLLGIIHKGKFCAGIPAKQLLIKAAMRVIFSAYPLAAKGLPQLLHQVIQCVFSLGFQSQSQVQIQGKQSSLGVIADDGVGGVFILFVELGPGIEARICQALQLPARHAIHPGHGLG